jgi:hypothetical protein
VLSHLILSDLLKEKKSNSSKTSTIKEYNWVCMISLLVPDPLQNLKNLYRFLFTEFVDCKQSCELFFVVVRRNKSHEITDNPNTMSCYLETTMSQKTCMKRYKRFKINFWEFKVPAKQRKILSITQLIPPPEKTLRKSYWQRSFMHFTFSAKVHV